MPDAADQLTFFTSMTNSYFAKACVLVESIRTHYPKARFVCMLCDTENAAMDYSVFDEVLHIDELPIPTGDISFWTFLHSVVELCTAVKPFAFLKLFETSDRVIYLDPDTVVFSPLVEVEELLERHPIVLTPHVTVPGQKTGDICDGEKDGCLRHGVFNLGFLALANRGQGADFVAWWAARCLEYCFDDIENGLFTDQRWIDLAPCFFEDLNILRHPGYNVATWNLYYRDVQQSEGKYAVNGQPLRFFHFSGFDIGTHELMLRRHAPDNAHLRELTDWYVNRQMHFGQVSAQATKGFYDRFSDGSIITKRLRTWFRSTPYVFSRYRAPYRSGPSLQRLFRYAGPLEWLEKLTRRVRRP